MKVTAVKTFLIHPGLAKNWLFVRVETDEGLHGWGEAYTQNDRDRAIETYVQELGRYLVGRSPFNIKHFTFMAYTDFANKRGAMDLYCAVSALEHALWDIVGKVAGQPVYNLLGGACRDKIKVYANGWGGGGTVDQLAENAAKVIRMGFSALKFDPFPGPWRTIIDRRTEQAAADRVRAVREAVGPDVEILVEAHRRLSPVHAIQVARLIEPYNPFWYEEPVSARDLSGLAEAKRNIRIPVVTGEELYTKAEFREVFERRAADIINPDVCNCGGILELREIAAMAEPCHVAVSPHNYNSTTVGLAATLHATAGMPNFLITEYFVNFTALGDELSVEPLRVEKGYIPLPTRPGLGVELNEAALAKYPYRPFPDRKLRQIHEEGP
ncbi:mandelate racemase/muconate lactonizing enzyme family protein [bacterium]|nr:mandelate racemase/muconate lactonizing enzyme family protein [bacterium]